MSVKHAIVPAGVLALLLAFLPPQEGTKYKAYLDPVGVPTICEGSTKGVKMGMVLTRKECDERLAEDIEDAHKVLRAHVPAKVRAAMHPKTEAMFTSFVFQYGPGGKGNKDGFVYLKSGRHSTMYNKLQVGDVVGACNEMPKWNANKLRGIEKRLALQTKLCLEGVAEGKAQRGL